MNHVSKIALVLSIIFFTSLSNIAYSENNKVDPRLGGFLVSVIKDNKVLKEQTENYAYFKVTFEEFIIGVFTEKVKFNYTPDTNKALSQLDGYIENKRPYISDKYLNFLEIFNAKKENTTFMRSKLITTIKDVIGEQNKNSNK